MDEAYEQEVQRADQARGRLAPRGSARSGRPGAADRGLDRVLASVGTARQQWPLARQRLQADAGAR